MIIRRSWAVVVAVVGVFLAWLGQSGYKYKLAPKYSQSHTIQDITYTPESFNARPRDRNQVGQENAVIYMLVRNFEVQEALASIRQIEDRFNRKYKYPWVFLNDEKFTDEFMDLTSGMVSGESTYGFIEPEDWNVPDHINRTRMMECMDDMVENNVIYGGSLSYRNMCRYNSGKFFWHPLLLSYDWYWRVEPGIKFFCDQNYDPFTFMRENDKVYGFVISLYEVPETIPTLWATAEEFFTEIKPESLAQNNALGFVTDKKRIYKNFANPEPIGNYNLCHFWSNFEIGSLNFFRRKEYTDYFNHLDQKGGFYYERWGDAPVHTLGVTAFANRSQIHHFSDMGYYHVPFWRCPHDAASYQSGRCLCPEQTAENVDFQPFSCLALWWNQAGRQHLFNFSQEPMY